MFWEKIKSLCKKQSVTLSEVSLKTGISPATFSKWKNGSMPTADMLIKLSEYFDVNASYLLSDDEIVIRPSDKKILFKRLTSLPQRWLSLRSGSSISEEQLSIISSYTNSDWLFLIDISKIEYSPSKEYDKANLNNLSSLMFICDVMDRCADTEIYRALQIQLSRIVIYHLKNKGISKEEFNRDNYKSIHHDKVEFIYSGVNNTDATLNYGFNLTDLFVIWENTGLSLQYLFTGIEESPII